MPSPRDRPNHAPQRLYAQLAMASTARAAVSAAQVAPSPCVPSAAWLAPGRQRLEEVANFATQASSTAARRAMSAVAWSSSCLAKSARSWRRVAPPCARRSRRRWTSAPTAAASPSTEARCFFSLAKGVSLHSKASSATLRRSAIQSSAPVGATTARHRVTASANSAILAALAPRPRQAKSLETSAALRPPLGRRCRAAWFRHGRRPAAVPTRGPRLTNPPASRYEGTACPRRRQPWPPPPPPGPG